MMLRLMLVVMALVCIGHDGYAKGHRKLRSWQTLQLEDIERQTLDYSCGAASLSLLLTGYFAERYGELQLLGDMTSRLTEAEILDRVDKGFSMLDLKQTAERAGFNAVGVRLPILSVSKLRGPIIILLQKHKRDHFVVLKGAVQDVVFIADPTFGHISMTLPELKRCWDGSALILGREGFTPAARHSLSLPAGPRFRPEIQSLRALKGSMFHKNF